MQDLFSSDIFDAITLLVDKALPEEQHIREKRLDGHG